ncbi:hypothetical protein CDAR_497371 [Caerostris darwini]|uniref:Uncharacterized protein n=1 Tax=Caerostris darwini TaxID=1538125 RepID=A0AAV4RZ55_9ARAC|nr:hypothetical protein CDAR_497371 [Caerostris darwini]
MVVRICSIFLLPSAFKQTLQRDLGCSWRSRTRITHTRHSTVSSMAIPIVLWKQVLLDSSGAGVCDQSSFCHCVNMRMKNLCKNGWNFHWARGGGGEEPLKPTLRRSFTMLAQCGFNLLMIPPK